MPHQSFNHKDLDEKEFLQSISESPGDDVLEEEQVMMKQMGLPISFVSSDKYTKNEVSCKVVCNDF